MGKDPVNKIDREVIANEYLLNNPFRIRKSAVPKASFEMLLLLYNCGMKSAARTTGPATNWERRKYRTHNQ